MTEEVEESNLIKAYIFHGLYGNTVIVQVHKDRVTLAAENSYTVLAPESFRALAALADLLPEPDPVRVRHRTDPLAHVKVGDPDPTHPVGPWCRQAMPNTTDPAHLWICRRWPGHPESWQHIAANGFRVVAVAPGVRAAEPAPVAAPGAEEFQAAAAAEPILLPDGPEVTYLATAADLAEVDSALRGVVVLLKALAEAVQDKGDFDIGVLPPHSPERAAERRLRDEAREVVAGAGALAKRLNGGK